MELCDEFNLILNLFLSSRLQLFVLTKLSITTLLLNAEENEKNRRFFRRFSGIVFFLRVCSNQLSILLFNVSHIFPRL